MRPLQRRLAPSLQGHGALTGKTVNSSRSSSAPRENIHLTVWALAWPTIIANVLQNVAGLIDLYYVRGLGVTAQQAVTWGDQLFGVVFAVSIGVSVGTTALVARSTGEGDSRSVAVATRQSLLMVVVFSLVTMVLLMTTAHPILKALGADARSLPDGLAYYRTMLWGVGPFFLNAVAAASFRGTGDTRTPVYIFGAMNLINIALDSVLIWGAGPIPAFGVRGAALGSATARTSATLMFALAFWRSGLLHGATWKPMAGWWWRLLRIGIPASIQTAFRTVASLTYVGLLGRMAGGSAVVAALSVGLRAEGLAFMPGTAFNIAAATMVGQSLGQKDPERANRAAWAAVQQCMVIMSVIGVFFFVFAEPIARTLAAPEAQGYAADYLRIQALSEPFLAMAMTFTGALQGAGETIRPMWVMIFTMYVLRLPPTWFFGLMMGYGATAAWWSMSLSTVLQGTMMMGAWKTGTWKSRKV